VKKQTFIPYESGDWIVPRERPRGQYPLFKCVTFSGNYVFCVTFGFDPQVLRFQKAEYRKASSKDVARAIAWRLKGGV
jgi:hypothetical protein